MAVPAFRRRYYTDRPERAPAKAPATIAGERTVTRRGVEAEAMAAAFLERKGLRVLECNYRCRLGEIDLVARDGATTVFVEVRRRASSAFGGAAASITRAKRLRLVKAARHYLSRLGTFPPCRFDALLIEGDPPRIEWIRDAFGE